MTSDIGDYLSPATATRLQRPYTGTEGYSRGVSAVNRLQTTYSDSNPGGRKFYRAKVTP